jgi:phage-related tail fiber protein
MTRYYALLTNLGAAKLANAAALGTKLQITHMSVGDGGGTLPTPNASQTALVAEKRRAALNALSVDAANISQIIAEQIIPETDGGFWIREIGLFDADGVMIAVANCPETYKPQLQEGSGRTQTVRMILIVNSTEAVTLKIDPSVVLATRKYVDDRVIEVKAYADSLMTQHVAAANPHTQYAPKVSPALTGTPTAPTPAQSNNGTQIATTGFTQLLVSALSTTLTNALAQKAPLASPALIGTPTAPTAAQTVNNTQVATTAYVKAALAALVDSSPAALDTLKELATALGNDPNFATTMTNALAGKMDKAANGADIADVATFLNNLGLGNVAKRTVGNGVNQIPDMSFFSYTTGVYRFPNGLIIQYFSATALENDVITPIRFPVVFPAFCHGIFAAYNSGGVGNYYTFSDRTVSGANMRAYVGSATPITGGGTATIFALGR